MAISSSVPQTRQDANSRSGRYVSVDDEEDEEDVDDEEDEDFDDEGEEEGEEEKNGVPGKRKHGTRTFPHPHPIF
jgi:hypothetical protein